MEEKITLMMNQNIAIQRETQTIQDEGNHEVDQRLIGEVDVPVLKRNSQLSINHSLVKQNALVSIIPKTFLVEE